MNAVNSMIWIILLRKLRELPKSEDTMKIPLLVLEMTDPALATVVAVATTAWIVSVARMCPVKGVFAVEWLSFLPSGVEILSYWA
jgi:hypothetical protein